MGSNGSQGCFKGVSGVILNGVYAYVGSLFCMARFAWVTGGLKGVLGDFKGFQGLS